MTRALALVFLVLAACSDGGTYVVVRFDEVGAPAGISSIDLAATLGEERAELSVALRPGQRLPLTKGLAIGSGAGLITVDATARDAAGKALATARASATVVRGKTVDLALRFGAVVGGPDAGVPDAPPPPPIDAGPSGLVCVPLTHDFGKVAPGGDAVYLFTITNTNPERTGPISTNVTAGFALGRDECRDRQLDPNESCGIEVTFHAGAPGKRTGALTVFATPGGVIGATFEAVALEPATLVFMPPDLDFGSVVQQGTTRAPLQLANRGGVATERLALRLEGAEAAAFALAGGDCDGATLPAGGTCNISVAFSPAGPGRKAATLVAAAGTAAASAPLSGTGLLPGTIETTAPTFAATSVGGMTTAPLVVKNVGDTDALVGESIIAGSDAADFSVLLDGCRGVVLPAQGSCTLTLQFAPQAAGPKVASLTISASPGGQAAASLAASATAVLAVAREGMGRVRSSPEGIDCGAVCSAAFAASSVQLNATPDTGWSFAGWSGGGCGEGDACTVTLAGETHVAATFTPRSFPLSVTRAGAGAGTVTGDGIDCGETCSTAYVYGTMVTLTATPSAGSLFAGWMGAGCKPDSATCVVTMSDAQSVIATFQPAVTVMVQLGGTAGGSVVVAGGPTCTSSCSFQVVSGGAVMLTAMPTGDAVFAGWTGGGCGTSSTCAFMPTGDVTVMADFEPGGRVLTLGFQGTGGGRVTSMPDGLDCSASCQRSFPVGTPVTLAAEPAAGSTFVSWGGACSGSGSCQVTLDADVSVTARFDALPLRTLTVNVTGAGTGTVTGPSGLSCASGTCTKQYFDGTKVDLTATPGASSLLKAWSGECTGTGACSVTLSGGDKTVGAEFEPSVTVTIVMHPDAMYPTTVTSNPVGISCTTGTCSHVFLKGGSVTLSSVVSAQWGIECKGSKTCVIPLTASNTIDVYPGKVHFKLYLDDWGPNFTSVGTVTGFMGNMYFDTMGWSGPREVVVPPGNKTITVYYDVQGTTSWQSIPGCSGGDQCSFNLQDDMSSARVIIQDQ